MLASFHLLFKFQLELKEFEEKFRKAMIANAQLDNEKSSYGYQVDLLKDKLEELDETTAQLRRELREKNREAEQLKRTSQRLKEDFDVCRAQLLERDTLIEVTRLYHAKSICLRKLGRIYVLRGKIRLIKRKQFLAISLI